MSFSKRGGHSVFSVSVHITKPPHPGEVGCAAGGIKASVKEQAASHVLFAHVLPELLNLWFSNCQWKSFSMMFLRRLPGGKRGPLDPWGCLQEASTW